MEQGLCGALWADNSRSVALWLPAQAGRSHLLESPAGHAQLGAEPRLQMEDQLSIRTLLSPTGGRAEGATGRPLRQGWEQSRVPRSRGHWPRAPPADGGPAEKPGGVRPHLVLTGHGPLHPRRLHHWALTPLAPPCNPQIGKPRPRKGAWAGRMLTPGAAGSPTADPWQPHEGGGLLPQRRQVTSPSSATPSTCTGCVP